MVKKGASWAKWSCTPQQHVNFVPSTLPAVDIARSAANNAGFTLSAANNAGFIKPRANAAKSAGFGSIS